MLGWLWPTCPIPTREKLWVERRMLWLADRFGIDRMRNARVILPTAEFFSNDYSGSEADAKECFRRMCGHMGIDADSLEMVVGTDEEMPSAAGLYEQDNRSKIWIRESQLADPPSLLATIAHELAHELLLKGERLTTNEWDHELVTDLLPVFLGVGIFGANATLRFTSYHEGNYSTWMMSKQGYLSSIALGYALAVFAYIRGERKPRWRVHLRTDARLTLDKGLRYLRRTGDCFFQPSMEKYPEPFDDAQTAAALAHRHATQRLAGFWDLNEQRRYSPELFPLVEGCIHDRDPDVRCAAISALGSFGSAAVSAIPQLVQAAWYATATNVRSAAIAALGKLGTESEECVSALVRIVSDDDPKAAQSAAEALAGLGPNAEAAEPKLLEAFGSAISTTDYKRAGTLANSLAAIFPDAKSRVKQFMRGRSPEEVRVALGMMREGSN